MGVKKALKSISVYALPAGIAFFMISSYMPQLTEKYYSNVFYKAIAQPVSVITGLVPFSVAELFILFFVIWIIYGTVRAIISITLQRAFTKKKITAFVFSMIRIAGVIYLSFVLLWGMNYNRLSFAQIAGMNVQPSSLEELSEVCEILIHRANSIRKSIYADDDTMVLKEGKMDALLRTEKGYRIASEKYPELAGTYGRPKPVFFSKFMSYTGIWGIFFPFTAEANINMEIPDSMIPNTIAHEMAHQRGFAREDEANYIAYLVCSMHPDKDFQYSGLLLAIIHSMNSLYTYDIDEYKRLTSLYGNGIKNDLKEIDRFSIKYKGPIEQISTEINNAYLKANRQREGVHSYGRMVDLLIAEYRNSKR